MRPATQFVLAALVLAALAGFWSAVPLFAQQGTITGTILSEETAEPIPGADVSIVGTARGAVTNDRGEFRLVAPPGIHTLRVRSFAYRESEQRVTIEPGEEIAVDFRLAAAPFQTDEIVAIGSRTPRTQTETPVPVDVITSEEIEISGQTEVNQLLAVAYPPSTTPTRRSPTVPTTSIRPV